MSENGTVAVTEGTASTAAETTNQETDQAGAHNTEDIAYHT
jgi:hypothetical protein